MSDNTVKMLTLDEIVKADDLKEAVVEVPEWGGSVRIKAMSKATQQAVRDRCTVNDKLDGNLFEMQMFVVSIIEPKINPDMAETLRAKAMGPVDHVLKEVLALNGLDEDTIKQAKATFHEGDAKS